jgi:hypothetical protein
MAIAIDERIARAFEEQHGFSLEKHCVAFVRVGSDSHGTRLERDPSTSLDDVDYMAWVIPPANQLLGLKRFQHWEFRFEELDVVVYSLEKAVSLLAKANPNIVGVLWLEAQDWCFEHWMLDRLLTSRYKSLNTKLLASCVGYATDQRCRMEAFDLNAMARYEVLFALVEELGYRPEKVLTMTPEDWKVLRASFPNVASQLQEFRELHRKHFSGYMGTKRKGLVTKFGYDTKNAAHTIRILRMAREIADEQPMRVFRPDAEELKAIKRGEWSIDDVKAEADRLLTEIRELEAKNADKIPPDWPEDELNRMLVEMHQISLGTL